MIDERIENWLLDMNEAATNAVSFVDGMAHEDFLKDIRTQHAVAMCVLRIGENASRLTDYRPVFLSEHPQVSWHSMTNMRNRIAHGYTDINFNVVWDTVQEDLPNLIATISTILRQAGKQV